MFLLLSCLVVSALGKELFLKDVFRLSNTAIKSNDVKKNEDFLEKYVFTENKNTSIWYAARKETLEMFNFELGFEEMLSIETAIYRVSRIYAFCMALQNAHSRAECFLKVPAALTDARRDFIWNLSEDISKESKSKMGTLFQCYLLMTMHLQLVASKYLSPLEESHREKTMQNMNQVVNNLMMMLHSYESDVTQWRNDQITPVIMCDTRYVLWQPFEGACETRWRRSTDEDDDEVRGLSELTDNDRDAVSKSVEMIGTPNDSSHLTYVAKVYDGIADRNVFETKEKVLGSSRGDTLEKMFHDGIEKRGEYQSSVQGKVDKFMNGTARVARKAVTAYFALMK